MSWLIYDPSELWPLLEFDAAGVAGAAVAAAGCVTFPVKPSDWRSWRRELVLWAGFEGVAAVPPPMIPPLNGFVTVGAVSGVAALGWEVPVTGVCEAAAVAAGAPVPAVCVIFWLSHALGS